jgi:hypothetical protein
MKLQLRTFGSASHSHRKFHTKSASDQHQFTKAIQQHYITDYLPWEKPEV